MGELSPDRLCDLPCTSVRWFWLSKRDTHFCTFLCLLTLFPLTGMCPFIFLSNSCSSFQTNLEFFFFFQEAFPDLYPSSHLKFRISGHCLCLYLDLCSTASFSMYLSVHCYEPNTVPDAEDKMHKDPAREEFIFLYFGPRN